MKRSLTSENKKQEILDYLSKIKESKYQSDPISLSNEELKKKFKDDNYNEKDIDNFLTELKDDGLVNTNIIKINIFYLKSRKQQIVAIWNKYLLPYDELFIATLIYLVVVIATYFYRRADLGYAIIYPIILYIGYLFFQWAYQFGLSKIPLIRNFNVRLLAAVTLCLVITIAIAFIGAQLLHNEFNINILLSAMGVGIALAALVYNMFFKAK